VSSQVGDAQIDYAQLGEPRFSDLAQPRDHSVDESWTEGGGIVSSWADLVSAFGDPQYSAGGLVAAAAAAGLDAIDAVMNPLGALATALLGWLIEHVRFLHEPLDALAGDRLQIEDSARTWQSVALRLREVADWHRLEMQVVADWEGIAAVRYREAAVAYRALLHGAADKVDQAVAQILGSGVAVATVRAAVRDVVAGFVGDVIGAAAAAGLLALVSAGASVGGFVAWVVMAAVDVATEIARTVADLLSLLGRGAAQLAAVVSGLDDLASTLARQADGLARAADVAGAPAREAGKTGRTLLGTAVAHTRDIGIEFVTQHESPQWQAGAQRSGADPGG